MLLSFYTENYKSFRQRAVFSMEPAPKQKGLDYSVQSENVGSREYKALCSSVIYGPNASGKTNLIGAMEAFRAIVLRGNLQNGAPLGNLDEAASSLELIPNKDSRGEPVSFGISFLHKGYAVRYELTAYVGDFLQRDAKRRVLRESLYLNDWKMFERKEKSLSFFSLEELKKSRTKAAKAVYQLLARPEGYPWDTALELARQNVTDTDLFLMNGFRNVVSHAAAELVTEWIGEKLMIVYHSDMALLTPLIQNFEHGKLYMEATLNEAAKEFGINSNGLGYAQPEKDGKVELYSMLDDGKQKSVVPASVYESYGTLRFINIFPLLLTAMHNGATIVLDEFGASIHPMAIMNIINVFHNDEVNRHHAQLIFNTHNPIFLQASLFRRDEIKFVERDDVTHESELYSLADFGTSGEYGVRKNEDYMSNYFIDRYGAIRDVDFTPMFMQAAGEDKHDAGK